MSDQYKFEMFRFDESAQIDIARSVKTRGVSCVDIVYTFAEFLQACGFSREAVVQAYQQVEDDLSTVR